VPAQTPRSGGLHFDVKEPLQDLDGAGFVPLRPIQLDAEVLGCSGQLKVAEMVMQALIYGGFDRTAQCATSSSARSRTRSCSPAG
jgi:hypothetical protein